MRTTKDNMELLLNSITISYDSKDSGAQSVLDLLGTFPDDLQ